MTADTTTRRAFTRSDLLAVLAASSLAAALALAATRQMRQEAQAASSLSQLRWLAGATSSYAADSNDQFWSYSWKAGPLPHSDPTLPATASGDLQAASIQAADILRRRTGRRDIEPVFGLPHVYFNHLPLLDYLGAALPEFNLVAPGDTHRLNWARDPEAFDRGEFLPLQPEPTAAAKRWPYSSSYQAPAAWWDLSEAGSRVSQGVTQHTYVMPGSATLRGVALHDVVYPAQKVMLHDQEQRELGAEGRYCVAPDARTAVLMADGNAGMRTTVDPNPGWAPNSPLSKAFTPISYAPAAWEAPADPSGLRFPGRYRWTRGGIEGRDFGGPEIDTGQL